MKKVATLFFGVIATVASFAQVSIGIQGTGNLSDANFETPDLLMPSKKMRVLPGGGIVADVKLSSALSIRTGVNYLRSGITLESKMDGVPGEITEIVTTGKLNMNYLQVPLNLLYTTKGRTQFFVGGGPYFSYAFSGKSKVESTIKFADGTTETEKEEENVFEEDEDGETYWKRTDYGVGAIAGVKLPRGWFVNVGYQFSFANLSKSEDSKYNNRGLQLTLGCYLWRK